MRRATRRVFFVNRFFYPDESATSQLLSDLAFGLADSGMDVHVVCSRALYDGAPTRLQPRETIRGVAVHRLWTTRFGRAGLLGRATDYLTFYISCAFMLGWWLQKEDVIVAKTDPPLISIVAALAARLKGAILVNWLQDVFPEVATALGAVPMPSIVQRWLRGLRDRSLLSASVNVVIGERMQEFIVGRGVSAARTVVIENWASIGKQAPIRAADSHLRRRLGLQEKFVVGYSGNLGRAHEYEIFIDTARALLGQREIQFLFIGGGVHMNQLRDAAAQLALTNMHFLPYQPRDALEDSLGAVDLHLVSLRPCLEGLIVPSKFYGILAAGRPVAFVGDPDGELARVIGRAHCGLVVRSGDSAGLAHGIELLRTRPDLRVTYGAAARDLMDGHHGESRAIARWSELLRRGLNDANSS